jgi:energy-coupling factor transport system ATP-binding protein
MRHEERSANDIAIENLRLKFPGEPDIWFQDLSLHIPDGQKVLLLGPSGCGKSTLLQVLSGIIPHSVEVPLMCDRIQRPASWGFVFQDPDTQFCMPHVDEELAFVLENQQIPREEMKPRMIEALAKVGLAFGDLHVPIAHLSQGMKQRLALASVLLLRPRTVFLDEPSALLDPEGTAQIWQSVKQALHDHTVVVVEHKIDAIVDWIDRIILLDERGRLLADGEPDRILTQHRSQLRQYGIWYPSVWAEYVEARQKAASGRNVRERDGRDPRNIAREEARAPSRSDGPRHAEPPERPDSRDIVLELEHFAGYRGKACKIRVERASVARRSWVAVTGPNGAGKSTLLLALMQLIPTTGTYRLEGQAVPVQAKKRQPPPALSLVFQNPEMQFITHSIRDEVAFTLQKEGKSPEETEREVERLLRLFRLEAGPHRHPYELSVGQKRRLSVATVLLAQTSILLLDEPTFGQDARNTFQLLELLDELRADGKTILMVTHDRNIVEHFAT